MADDKSLELFLFTDEPVRDLAQDHLGLKPFSSMVAAAALTNRGPFNIGVFSGWGQGKTSVLRQSQALIEEQKRPSVITAWVNAWQYEHEAHPIVPLLAIIINEITKAIDSRKSLHEKENDSITKTFKDLKRALRSIAYGFSAKAGASIPGFANLEIGFVAKDMIDRDEKLSSDRDPLLDQSLYYHAYERLEAFREELAKASPAEQPKIVVFIDDLDRCLPSKALHLLESLKLVLAQPGFIFVLGVDRHVIDSFLTKRYHREFGIRAEKGHGKQYMDKIIQLPLDLPHHQNRFEKYIGSLILHDSLEKSLPPAFRSLFADAITGPAFIAALAAGCDRTPRTLIRTLNYLLTDLFLRENKFFNEDDDPFDDSAEFLQYAAVSRITRITFGSENDSLYRKFAHLDEWMGKQIAAYLANKESIWNASSTGPEWGYSSGEEGYKERDYDLKRIEPFRAAVLASESLQELFRSNIGQAWLQERPKRQAIEGFLATREEPASQPNENSRQIINDAIRVTLGLSKDQGIGDEDRRKITGLTLDHAMLSDLTPLKGLTNLEWLSCTGTQVSDLAPIKDLTKLKKLFLDFTGVSNLAPLKDLTKLQILNLEVTGVSDLSPLESLTLLEGLYLDGTRVTDLTTLRGLTRLDELYLNDTLVSDLTALESLPRLMTLGILNTPAAGDESVMSRLRKALPDTNITA